MHYLPLCCDECLVYVIPIGLITPIFVQTTKLQIYVILSILSACDFHIYSSTLYS
jgi:hypothetical protein